MTTPAPAGQTGYETTTYTYDGDGNVLTRTAPPATNGGPNQVTVKPTTPPEPARVPDDRVRHLRGLDRQLLLRPERRQDRGGDAGRQHRRHRRLRDSSPWVVSSATYPDAGGLPDHLQLRLGRGAGLHHHPGDHRRAERRDHHRHLRPGREHADHAPIPNGVTTTCDLHARTATPPAVSYSGSSAHSVSYSYDADGKQTAMTDAHRVPPATSTTRSAS